VTKVFRGLGALIAILAILIGAPTLLILWAGNPFPTPAQWQSIITFTPDYGNVIMITKILPLLCWVAWAAFAGPLIVEALAAIGGRTTRKRSWAFRGQQKFAATLVAAVALMFVGAGSLASAAPAQAITVSAPAAVATVSTHQATPHTAPTASAVVVKKTVEHTVRSGETLWGIAEHYYGDGEKAGEIFHASKGIVQADGRHLTDPDLIVTGWRLDVPNVAVHAAAAPVEKSEPVAPASSSVSGSSSTGHSAGGGVARGQQAPETGGDAVTGAARSSTSTEAEHQAAPQSQPAPANPVAPKVDKAPADDGAGSWLPMATAGGIGSLLAASLLTALWRRRTQQRRRRAPGERIAMPDEAAASFELELRMVENPVGIEDIDNALRSLQVWAEDTGAQLPELLAVRLADDEVAVYLTEPADLPAPFTPAHPDKTAWVVAPGAAVPPARKTVSPYPALTTIGTDDANGVLLLDLEEIGSLNVVGDNDIAVGVLNALAVSLAESPWSDQIQITLVGMPAGPARELSRAKIQHVDDVAALVRNLKSDMEDRRDALDSYDVGDVHDARVRANEMESWAPHIVILGAPPEGELRDELADLVKRMPRLGIATVANGDTIEAGSTVVISDRDNAEYQSGGQLPPLPFHPQIFAGEEEQLFQALIDTTNQDAHTVDLEEENAPRLEAAGITGDQVDTAAEDDDLADAAVDDVQLVPIEDIITTPAPIAEVEAVIDEEPVIDEPAQEPETSEVDAPAAVNAPAIVEDVTAAERAPEVAVEPEAEEVAVSVGEASTDALMQDAEVTVPEWPAPYIRLLGPVDVLNVADAETLPGRGAEMMAYLLLQDGPVPGAQLQKAMWKEATDRTNNNLRQLATKVRSALGNDPDGKLLLPAGRKDTGFTIHPAIRTDWDDFRQLIGPDLKTTPNADLIAAIRLVRGAPFEGVSRRTGWWTWRANTEEVMIAAIIDAAAELSERALQSGKPALSRFAARIAQSADELNEAGWRLELMTALHINNTDEFDRVLTEMTDRVSGGDPDHPLDEATLQLIDTRNSLINHR